MTLAERLSSLNWGGTGYTEYLGFCKGNDSQNEMNQANTISQQQFNLMQQQLSSINSALSPVTSTGFFPGQQQSLNASLINSIPQQTQQIAGNINDQLVARGITGGSNAGSGDIARNYAGLGAMESGLMQQGQSQIAQLGSQQRLGALSLQSGLLSGFNQGGLSALSGGITAANNADQSQMSWLGPLLGAAGSLGSAVVGENPGNIFGK